MFTSEFGILGIFTVTLRWDCMNRISCGLLALTFPFEFLTLFGYRRFRRLRLLGVGLGVG